MSDRDAAIGIFDSGVGGLTVARSIIDQLPDENVIYVGDTAHGPYGPLSIPQVREHALAIGDDLVDRGVKALVIACNTASAACLRDARERYDVPVVEVILPAVRRAVAATRSGRQPSATRPATSPATTPRSEGSARSRRSSRQCALSPAMVGATSSRDAR